MREIIKIDFSVYLTFPAPRINAKRRVKLRRDPVMDKGHRSKYIISALITFIIEAPLRRPKLEIREFALDSNFY